MEFERSKGGLYLPAQTSPTRPGLFQRLNAALGGAWLTTSINSFVVLIQLFTVWVLWLTYQNTVIPTRQKELLSEQLAQLELERKQVIAEIAKARGDARLAGAVLEQKQQELQRLTVEKSRLSRAVENANFAADSSLQAAKRATALAGKAGKELYVAQMSLFQQHASMIVATPEMTYRYGRMTRLVREVNEGLGEKSKYATVDEYFAEVRETWPRVDQMASEVSSKLRNSRSNLFPSSFSNDLAVYLVEHAKTINCAQPNYEALRGSYDEWVSSNREKRRKDSEEREAQFVADGLRKGVRYVISDEGRRQGLAIDKQLAEYDGRSELRKSVDAAAQKCFDRFGAIADDYFKEKGAVVQTIPSEVGALL